VSAEGIGVDDVAAGRIGRDPLGVIGFFIVVTPGDSTEVVVVTYRRMASEVNR
jgi:hypothetical protein